MERPDEFKDLQTLLRLKKYEQPPAGYEERFLNEFHRRQRWEASQPRGFALLRERFNGWVGSFTVPKYAYAGTFGLFLAIVAAVSGINGKPAQPAQLAVSSSPVAIVASRPTFALNQPLDLSDLDVQSAAIFDPGFSQRDSHPRYILDARPASYEAALSF